jgi:hypothetical protein
MWIMEIHHSGTKFCWNGSGQESDELGEARPAFLINTRPDFALGALNLTL